MSHYKTDDFKNSVRGIERFQVLLLKRCPALSQVLMGFSFGSYLVRLHQQTYPSTVDRLIVIGTVDTSLLEITVAQFIKCNAAPRAIMGAALHLISVDFYVSYFPILWYDRVYCCTEALCPPAISKVECLMIFRLGELFCGPGGLACGALRSKSADGQHGLVHAWANDYDPDTCATYRKNICPDAPETVYCGDVRNLDITSLGDIDAFAYGFPCNSFSNVGEHKGFKNEKFGQLYWYGIEVLRHYSPLWFVAENVSGIRSAGSGDFQVILNDMRECGYEITPHLYKAEQYGVPQTRHRVIIVGIRKDVDVRFRVPSPEPYKGIDVTAHTALLHIPEDAPNNEVRNLAKKVVTRLSLINPGENVWQAEQRLGENFPDDLKIHTKTKISQIYRKLDPRKPSYTVTAAGGGGTFMYHWTDRELSNRERARIQTFPDDYEFVGNYSSVRKQIGMAVPCQLSEVVITAILNCFAGIDYPYIEPNLNG